MLSILVGVVVVGAVCSATPQKVSDEPAVVVLEVDADGSTSERTSMMRREVEINKHQRAVRVACDTNVALDTSGDSERMWAGSCKTLADCQAACKRWAGCTAFNWWPKKGGCRLVKGDLDENINPRNTSWTTISGVPDCVLDLSTNISTLGPFDCGACATNCAPKQCSSHPACKKLYNSTSGDCCPSSGGIMLPCCERVYFEAQIMKRCASHRGCNAIGRTGDCCPTSAGVLLECCDQDLDRTDF